MSVACGMFPDKRDIHHLKENKDREYLILCPRHKKRRKDAVIRHLLVASLELWCPWPSTQCGVTLSVSVKDNEEKFSSSILIGKGCLNGKWWKRNFIMTAIELYKWLFFQKKILDTLTFRTNSLLCKTTLANKTWPLVSFHAFHHCHFAEVY